MATRPSLLIRADASVAIGSGHVMRCIALAQAWQDAGGEATLAAAELPDSLTARLVANKISVLRVEVAPGSSGDASCLIGRASQLKPKWIVVDGDRFGWGFLQAIRDSGFRSLLIDDYADRPTFPPDMIVNPNFGVNPELYRNRGFEGAVLAGSRYALLRREFQEPFQRQVRQRGDRVLVTLGGSDPENLTSEIARALAACLDFQIMIVAGGAYPNKNHLINEVGTRAKLVFDSQEMRQLMMEADVAITIAGGTLWELLSVGCAVLSYARTAGGAYLVNCLANQGMIVDMGELSHFEPAKIVPAVRQLAESSSTRQRMATRGQALVDGLGAKRVVEMLKLSGR
jgi:UDP-2,4-diacetamido-2,4,6-trideoxy-beta-L-altropyranose hydrolase